MQLTTPNADSYQVGWICAILTEYVVACELLDEEYRTPPLPSIDDSNIYTCGRMGDFHVVVACLPKGRYGLTSAATVAKDLLYSFPSIRFGLMVGIGGGAPTRKQDIRLGDIVVSAPARRADGVIHYEFGRTVQNKAFTPVGHLSAPPRVLLTAAQQLDAFHQRRGHQILETISQVIQRNPRLQNKYRRPPAETDILFQSPYLHQEDSRVCTDCCSVNNETAIPRPCRGHEADEGNIVQVHYGLIASADRLMKDATVRDHLAETEGVLCFEMEAAGLTESFPCLVIRGICDYSDTHKNDVWQGYAAATAAAYAKELLAIMPKRDMAKGAAVLAPSGKGALVGQGDGQLGSDQSRRRSKIGKERAVRGLAETVSILQKIGFDETADVPKSFVMAIENFLRKDDIENFRLEMKLGFSQDLPYFFAGAFMFPSTIRAVTNGTTLQGIISSMTAATLRGYKRHAVKGGPWPALSPSNDPRDEVTGMAVFGLHDSQRQSIHRFQGGMFDFKRAIIEVEMFEGIVMPLEVGVYVWNRSDDYLIPTELATWDPNEMLRSDWLRSIFENVRPEEIALETGGDHTEARAETETWTKLPKLRTLSSSMSSKSGLKRQPTKQAAKVVRGKSRYYE